MRLHGKSPCGRAPFRSNRLDARQCRHRLCGAGAGGHAEGIVRRPRCQHPHCGPADYFRRHRAVRGIAGHGLAHQPDRAAHAPIGDARGSGGEQYRLGLRARLREPAGPAACDARHWRDLHTAGRRHRSHDRAGNEARLHRCLRLPRLVAGRRDRPAADRAGRAPLRLARGLWRHRRAGHRELAAADMAPASRVAGCARTIANLARSRAQPAGRAAPFDHHALHVWPVRDLHLHGTAARQADRRRR